MRRPSSERGLVVLLAGSDLFVSAIQGGSVGSLVDGTYGQIRLFSNGSYSYTANKTAADTLDDGDTVTDSFTYTVSDDANNTDTATITITVRGINDPITAVNDTDAVDEDQSISRGISSSKELDHDDTDPDGSDSSHNHDVCCALLPKRERTVQRNLCFGNNSRFHRPWLTKR